ncbi:MAG TPA: hypothetical protein VGG81_09875 [Edaphobacter sp.]
MKSCLNRGNQTAQSQTTDPANFEAGFEDALAPKAWGKMPENIS